MSAIKIKKFVSIKGVIDNFRQSVTSPIPTSGSVRLEQEIVENLIPAQFTVEYTIRHGFPFRPVCMAYDPLQRILAMGNRSGEVRIIGKPGISREMKHDTDCQVNQIIFLVNEGKLLTLCSDDSVNLWDFRKRTPELVHTLRMTRERLTFVSLEFQDRWMYMGTDKGNVYLLNVDSFQMSGYQICWNKTIDLAQTTRPGAIAHLSINPVDSGKLLICYDTGCVCVWDLNQEKRELGYNHSANIQLRSACWHMDGKQIIASFADGSLVTWNTKMAGDRPVSVIFPHVRINKDTKKPDPCEPIDKVIWKVDPNTNEPYIVFSGGLPSEVTGVTPSVTVMSGKSTTLIEMEYCVIDFVVVTDSPYPAESQELKSIIVMLSSDLVAIDCRTGGYPCYHNPYAMDLSDSPVTCCSYFADCPGDLIPALYLVGSRMKREGLQRGLSGGAWPISGGIDPKADSCRYTELIITGHADGTVRFWDSSASSMQSLYRLRTARYFDKAKRSVDGADEDPFAIVMITMCLQSKALAVAGSSGQVIQFSFNKKETNTDTKFMEIPIIYEVQSASTTCKSGNAFEFPARPPVSAILCSNYASDPADGFNFELPTFEFYSPLKLKPGSQKRLPGYHAELVCVTPWVNGEAPSPISCLTLNTRFGLMAYGNGAGLVIVDTLQAVCLLNMGTADLYGSTDPFQRMPKSPRPLDLSPLQDIVRVDLSNYSQVGSDRSDKSDSPRQKETAISRNRSPERRLLKMNSTLDESSLASGLGNLNLIKEEGICAVEFVDSFPVKNEFGLEVCLYIGTTLGSVIVVTISLPELGEARMKEPVVVSPSGSLYRNCGGVLCMAFLDCSLKTLTTRGEEPLQNVHVTNKPRPGNAVTSKESSPAGDQQVAVISTTKGAAVYGLPSQKQIYAQPVDDTYNVLTARVVNFGGSRFIPCLMCYADDGCIKCYIVPSLRPMLDVFLVDLTHSIKTMCFAHYGHGAFFANDTELQKFSVSAEFVRQSADMCGSLFTDNVPVPEPPKQGFLRGLFGGGPKPFSADDLFGENAGKAKSGIAKHIPGAGAQAAMLSKGAGATSEVAKAKMAVVERGQKLNELEDRTEAMANEAKQYATSAHNLMLSYKNKKFYQL